jgi:Transposase domain (DUF772)
VAPADDVQGAAGGSVVRSVRRQLAEALDDRTSFRRFCGFSSTEATPEHTAFVRFRRALIARGLDRTSSQLTRYLGLPTSRAPDAPVPVPQDTANGLCLTAVGGAARNPARR